MNVFAIDISSLINKKFHCAHLKMFNCNVQGSSLTERLKQSLRVEMQYQSTNSHFVM